jgi:thymidylate kinase
MIAKLITLEGIDSCGKSTQASLLHRHFVSRRLRSKLVKFPYDDVVTHRVIYGMLANGLAKRYPTAFQAIQFVNKLLFQLFVLPWLLVSKDVIVFDRWTMSAKAYGAALGVSRFVTHTLNHVLMRPTMTVLITGPKRPRSGVPDSYEADDLFQKRVHDEYVKMSGRPDVLHFTGIGDEVAKWTAEETSMKIVYELWLRNLPTRSVDPRCEC